MTEPLTEPLLLVYDLGEGRGTQCFVSDHAVFKDLRGYHTDEDLSFYSNSQHLQVLDEIGGSVVIYGNNLNSTENKVNTLIALFQSTRPVVGQCFRGVILLHPF